MSEEATVVRARRVKDDVPDEQKVDVFMDIPFSFGAKPQEFVEIGGKKYYHGHRYRVSPNVARELNFCIHQIRVHHDLVLGAKKQRFTPNPKSVSAETI